MDPTITVAIISAAGIIVSGIISALISNSIMKYRVGQLEKKVDKHNNLIERTYQLESEVTTIKHDIKLYHEKGE